MPVISHTSPIWNRIPIVGKSHFVRNIAVCLVYNFFWCHTIFLYAWCARMESNHHPRFRRPVYYPLYYGHIKLAEVVGFEPTDPFEPSVFKTAALSHAQPYFHDWMRVIDSNYRCSELMRLEWWPPYPRKNLVPHDRIELP